MLQKFSRFKLNWKGLITSMSKAIIISGEASETSSEDEDVQCSAQIVSVTPIQGAVILGEASESDNENDGSICSAISALEESNNGSISRKQTCDKCDSLLHQKLRESNGKLHQDLECFCQNIVSDAHKTLNVIDQHLIKSQLTLQSAVSSLKTLNINSITIKNKLQSLLSAQFIPNINVSNQ